jgi:hypothetical protein
LPVANNDETRNPPAQHRGCTLTSPEKRFLQSGQNFRPAGSFQAHLVDFSFFLKARRIKRNCGRYCLLREVLRQRANNTPLSYSKAMALWEKA